MFRRNRSVLKRLLPGSNSGPKVRGLLSASEFEQMFLREGARADRSRHAFCVVVFSVEAVYFYPWGATFRELGLPGLVAIGLFAVPLIVGLAYEWAKGALDW